MRSSPLEPIHKSLGAVFTAFGGYRMPLSYSSALEEALAVRKSAGVFDISHMGRLKVSSRSALRVLDYLTTNALSRLQPGRVHYTLFLNEEGGIRDDVTLYRLSDEEFFICTNAVNREKIKKLLSEFLPVSDLTESYVQIALQGPKSGEILGRFFDVSGMKRFSFRVFGDVIVSRTGYTGEDGYEIYAKPEEGKKLFLELSRFAKPCGLSARDILRIEAGFVLYGNEISERITPKEARLMRFVDTRKDFLGKEALLKKAPRRELFGLELRERGVPRRGQRILKDGKPIGVVTSGTYSPVLGKGVGLCFVIPEERKEGSEVVLDAGGRKIPALLRDYPFVGRR
ncbi:MAG: glycine cleavage system aminomethyltransferase GcvT [Aquificae bacterium]|nr:glycine cleavage system aminomethyltransferase GcvT [Aquificota bacterium]